MGFNLWDKQFHGTPSPARRALAFLSCWDGPKLKQFRKSISKYAKSSLRNEENHNSVEFTSFVRFSIV